MGAKVWIEDNRLCAKAENGLKGADIFLLSVQQAQLKCNDLWIFS